jgi:hypothetical protein
MFVVTDIKISATVLTTNALKIRFLTPILIGVKNLILSALVVSTVALILMSVTTNIVLLIISLGYLEQLSLL